jgi:hypothetical protein
MLPLVALVIALMRAPDPEIGAITINGGQRDATGINPIPVMLTVKHAPAEIRVGGRPDLSREPWISVGACASAAACSAQSITVARPLPLTSFAVTSSAACGTAPGAFTLRVYVEVRRSSAGRVTDRDSAAVCTFRS